ncbi:hypothetical protein A7U60_g7945 [Sanghuangporus baumii]|uniref:Uncharacterized protein n=1 Tax=Sanghuangporus baumii TaxID=108892 RepID=A0A9Q5MZ43_SANBA|nr:hypothetical protein A7U60_g7945 [Sanghuangporus baumii]
MTPNQDVHQKGSMSSKKRGYQYQQPEGLIAGFFWRLWMKLTTTFALSMLETWEIVLIFIITGSVTLLVTAAFVRYFPHAVWFATQQARYYLSGSDVSLPPRT